MNVDVARCDGVSVIINRHTILNDVHWTMPSRCRSAILGANGSGKSTLLRTITGFIYPTEGNVWLLGEQLGKTVLDVLRRRVGMVDPGAAYPVEGTLTALEVVVSGFFQHSVLHFDEPTQAQWDRAERTLKSVGLASKRKLCFEVLSQGEQRRVLLARALVHEPELLILDEPTHGLDLLARETWLATLDAILESRPEMALIMVTHMLEELPRQLEQVVLLRAGEVAHIGSPKQVLTSEHLSHAFDCPVTVSQEDGRWHWRVSPAHWQELTVHWRADD